MMSAIMSVSCAALLSASLPVMHAAIWCARVGGAGRAGQKGGLVRDEARRARDGALAHSLPRLATPRP